MDRPNYTEPRMEVFLLTVEAGFAGSDYLSTEDFNPDGDGFGLME